MKYKLLWRFFKLDIHGVRSRSWTQYALHSFSKQFLTEYQWLRQEKSRHTSYIEKIWLQQNQQISLEKVAGSCWTMLLKQHCAIDSAPVTERMGRWGCLHQKLNQRRIRMENEAYHLISQHQDRLQREFPPTIHQQVLETRSQQIKHEHIVLPVYAWPSYCRNTTCTYTHTQKQLTNDSNVTE